MHGKNIPTMHIYIWRDILKKKNVTNDFYNILEDSCFDVGLNVVERWLYIDNQ